MRIPLTMLAVLFSAGAAMAQAANPEPKTPAITTQDSAQPAQPAKGANSFTEAQALKRFEDAGFTNITGIAKDDDGVWRAKAMKNGAEHDVALDYQGNIFPRR